MKSIRVSAALIFDKEGRLFATQRGYGEHKGFWEFPGGKQEPGESGEDAVVREIKEELNTTIKVDSFFMTTEYQYPNFFLTMDCYICSIVEGDLTLLEHQDARWLKKEEYGTVNWLPADDAVLRKLLLIASSEIF